MPQRLPTRVIDVGPTDGFVNVKVVETDRRLGMYVALSHCWGKQQIITTTTKNIEDHKKAIPFQKLSKTFKDAVIVTRKLRMRFLWNDSLCILQDSGANWAKESAYMNLSRPALTAQCAADERSRYMGDIYRTATATIAAAGAEAGAIGCLIPRTTLAMNPITIQYVLPNNTIESIHIDLPRGSFRTGLDDGLLQSRAWCLQERVLSRRTIHFCKEHIVWEC